MGMFDTFHIQDRGRNLGVQSKQFAKVLNNYRLGDFVLFDAETPRGVTAWIQDHREVWTDPECQTDWVVLLLVGGCYLDAFVAEDEAQARNAAEVMVKLWQSPERHAESLMQHAHEHYLARASLGEAISRIGLLLGDFVEWQARQISGEPKPAFLGCLHHDFDQESWDWALARRLLALPEYREGVPPCYAVGERMEQAGMEGRTP